MTEAVSAPPRRPARLGTRECLNGIRAIAVLCVIAFHLGYGFASGGYFGVDMFFVLSGFLITSLLMREFISTGSVDLRGFWLRRARRLLPAMVVCLTVILMVARWLTRPDVLGNLRSETFGALFYYSNWLRVLRGESYFDLFLTRSPTEHFWSLAIEEQFYLVWPFIMAAFFAWCRRNRSNQKLSARYGTPTFMLGTVLAVVSASIMAVSYGVSGSASTLYFRTDTRLQAIFIGVASAGLLAAIGGLNRVDGSLWLTRSGWVAAALLGLAIVFDLPEAWRYRGGFLMVALCCAWLIITVMLVPGGRMDLLLRNGFLQFVGRLSYGLYLWHLPAILVADRLGWSRVPHDACALLLTFVCAGLSYRYVERPVRKGRLGNLGGKFSVREALVASCAFAVAAVFALGTTAGAEMTAQQRYERDQQLVQNAMFKKVPNETTVVVIGDAFGAAFGSQWPSPDGKSELKVTNLSNPQCVATSSCSSAPSEWPAGIRSLNADVVVVAIKDWSAFEPTDMAASIDSSSNNHRIADQVHSLVKDLVAGHLEVLVVTPPPALSPNPAAIAAVREAIGAISVKDRRISSVAAERLKCVSPKNCYSGTEAPDSNLMVEGLERAVAAEARVAHARSVTGVEVPINAVRVLILGDSIAWSIGTGWFEGQPFAPPDAATFVLNRGQFFCNIDGRPARDIDGTLRMNPTTCEDWRTSWKQIVDEFDPDIVVFPASIWTILDRQIDGNWVGWDTPDYQKQLEAMHVDAVKLMASAGATVALVSTAPRDGAQGSGHDLDEQNRRLGIENRMFQRIAAEHSNIATFVNLADYICPNGVCGSIDGLRPRPDGLHYSASGSSTVAKWLEPQLLKLVAERDSSKGDPGSG